jgi:hypothetical protein
VPLNLSSGEVQNGRMKLQLDGQAPGIYLLRVESQGSRATRKVLIH